MSAASDYLKSALINHILRQTAFSSPTALYVSLFVGAAEVSGGSYARVDVTTGFTAPVGGVSENASTISFPSPTAAWGTVTHAALYDAASDGNQLMYAPLNESKTITAGDTVRFNAASMDVSVS